MRRKIILLATLALVLPLALVSDFHLPAQPDLRGIAEPAQGQGQGQFNGPLADCLPNVIITDAHWIDKKNGDDIIRVNWQTVSQSACQNFSAKPSQATGSFGGVSPGFRAGYEVKVTVIRFLGGEDTGSGTVAGGLLGAFSAVVQVPSNHVRQPVSCKIQIRGSGSGFGSEQARITGNGVPSIESGAQTSGPSPGSENFRPECLPKITITGLTYTPGSGGQKDSVTVNWNTVQSVSPCLRILNFGVVVRLKRGVVGGDSVGSVSAGANANSATIQVSGGKGQVSAFEVTVEAQAFSPNPLNLLADKTINF
jgi:hypothetical protein